MRNAPVTVRRILRRRPDLGVRELPIYPTLGFGLIIHAIDPHDALEEDMQLRVRTRVFRHFKQRLEHVCGALSVTYPPISVRPLHDNGPEKDALLKTSSKFSTVPVCLYKL